MHMAFLSRVFKNLQWYGMTSSIEKPPFRRFFCVISSIFEVCLTTFQLWSER